MRNFKTCHFCVHGIYDEDWSVGIPGGYDCDNPNIPDDFDDETLGAEDRDCQFFEPIIHEKCDVCSRPMNAPLWSCENIYHGAFGDYVCCCQECVEAQKAKEAAELKAEAFAAAVLACEP